MNTKTKDMVMMGLMMALVIVGTMVIQIPSPTGGYIHPGDAFIMLSAATFGRRGGFLAGGVGSALADFLSGYGHYVPFTLVIKGLMGFVMGMICESQGKHFKYTSARTILAGGLAAVIMVVGYFFTGWYMTGSAAVALASLWGNLVQGFGGLIIYIAIGVVMDKIGLKDMLK